MRYSLVRVAEPSDRQVYHAIRRSSLWEERGRLGYDDARPEELFPNHHALLLKRDEAGIGTTRLDDLGNGTGIVRLVAITAALRRNGHGRVLDAMVADYARALGLGRLFVSAASDAEGFLFVNGMDTTDEGCAGPPRTSRGLCADDEAHRPVRTH
ncbi:N-acetylglutamate synthase-like GNAT family acetyltransferase [Methylorubrum pseudosasae]|nr:N-acetylglutamate synthase-like GNAT family acetyltransferase [Methylorubrum pseudosasae]